MAAKEEPEILSYEELFFAVENDPTENNFKKAANLLMSAVNDWPALNLKQPKDLIHELKNEVREGLTLMNLTKYEKRLRPEYDAWRMEAVSSLLEIFEFSHDKADDLESIIMELTRYYRKQKTDSLD